VVVAELVGDAADVLLRVADVVGEVAGVGAGGAGAPRWRLDHRAAVHLLDEPARRVRLEAGLLAIVHDLAVEHDDLVAADVAVLVGGALRSGAGDEHPDASGGQGGAEPAGHGGGSLSSARWS